MCCRPPDKYPKCANGSYRNHYVCLQCKVGLKDHDDFNPKAHDLRRCPKCSMEAHSVGRNMRIPKKSDKNGWLLLKKILVDSFVDLPKLRAPDETFATRYCHVKECAILKVENRWLTGQSYNGSSSQPFEDQHTIKVFYYPKSIREYPSWLKYLKETIVYPTINSRLRWNMIRSYLKTRSTVKYWMKMTVMKNQIRKKYDCTRLRSLIDRASLQQFNVIKCLLQIQHLFPFPTDVWHSLIINRLF